MSQAQLYTKAAVYINGSLLTEQADVRVTRTSGLAPVYTTAKGWAGFTQGASSMQVEVGNAVPFVGFEYDTSEDQANANFVQITVVAAGRTLTADGGITGDDFSYAINSEAKLNFSFFGEFADWKIL